MSDDVGRGMIVGLWSSDSGSESGGGDDGFISTTGANGKVDSINCTCLEV